MLKIIYLFCAIMIGLDSAHATKIKNPKDAKKPVVTSSRKTANENTELSKELIEQKIAMLIKGLGSFAGNSVKAEISAFPFKIGKFHMECAKYTTKKNADRNSSNWVLVPSINEKEKDRLENQFGENGDVELILELNKDVSSASEVSFLLQINDRFIIDRIRSTDSVGFQLDQDGSSSECKQEFKANFEYDKKVIFSKIDKTQCGKTTSIVKTEINRAIKENTKSEIKDGSYEIFVQHTIVEGSEKSKKRNLQSNLYVSCNFDPIK